MKSKEYYKLFTKKQLEEEYQNKSVCDIAKKFKIPQTCMYRLFEKFDIKRRNCNTFGKLASGFKHGKCTSSLPKFCKCGKKLSNNPNAKKCIKCHNYSNSINKNRLKKVSKAIKEGYKNRNFSKLLHVKRLKYKGIWMRSSWEIKFAKWCDIRKIKWQYESKTFDLGNTTYTPDFYLPAYDMYIEIKGYFRNNAKEKMLLFKKIYKDIELKLFDKQHLTKLGVL